jgi:linoleoyl-CoA desaturase
MKPRIKYKNLERSDFNKVIKKRVNDYFNNNKLSRNADGRMWFKVWFILGVTLLSYLSILYLGSNLSILSPTMGPVVLLLLACLLGTFTAFIGLNICHDAIHESLSSKSWVNSVFGFLFNVVGSDFKRLLVYFSLGLKSIFFTRPNSTKLAFCII